MMVWRLALRFLKADLRSGELRGLLVSVGLAVTALTSVTFFTDRVERGLERQGSHLLAADLVLQHNQPLPIGVATEAQTLGLNTTRTLEFPSVIFDSDRPVLIQVKAIGAGYPLRGDLILDTGSSAQRPPAADAVWVEPRLLRTLAAQPGDPVKLGDAQWRIAGIIDQEPDRGGNLIRVAPRVMLDLAQIERTGLIGPASRVKHRLLIAGPANLLAEFRQRVEDRLPQGAEILTVANARPELRLALEQGSRFLGLAALCAVLLAGAAVALATHRFVRRQTDSAAMLRCFGLQSRHIFAAFALRLCILGLGAALSGIFGGYLFQFGLTAIIGNWFADELPQPGFFPAIHGLLVGLALLLGFALPPLLRLREVPTLRVLRRDLDPPPATAWLGFAIAGSTMSLLIIWQAGDLNLAVRILGGVLGTLLALVLTARGLIGVLRLRSGSTGSAWARGLGNLRRRPDLASLQAAGFGLGILALLLLALVRVDLLAAWRANLPPQAPDHFLLNIQPDDVADLNRFLDTERLRHSGVYPMIRARLTAIGGRRVDPETYESPRARRLAAREFNLSYAEDMQSDNRLAAGDWWSPVQRDIPMFSVEVGLAQALGIEMGDVLQFDVAGQRVTGPVTSLREVQWDSFNVNFFVIGTPVPLAHLPATFVTSFHLPADREGVIDGLAQQFPSASVLDVKPLLAQVRAIMNQGSRAIEAVFLFALAAGVLVLFAAVQTSREERALETAVLRTLGAPRSHLLRSSLIEFGVLGLLAGLLAAAMASGVEYMLATHVFALPWTPNLALWISGAAIGMLCVTASGVLATYPLINTAPIRVLRAKLT